jgi:aspartate/methionine/tyrosine aminotransferase
LASVLVDATVLEIWVLIVVICELAVQIARRRTAHLLKHPDAKIISLGIGDTTEPIPEVITNAMAEVYHCF